jgi:hypothetical protein
MIYNLYGLPVNQLFALPINHIPRASRPNRAFGTALAARVHRAALPALVSSSR